HTGGHRTGRVDRLGTIGRRRHRGGAQGSLGRSQRHLKLGRPGQKGRGEWPGGRLAAPSKAQTPKPPKDERRRATCALPVYKRSGWAPVVSSRFLSSRAVRDCGSVFSGRGGRGPGGA